MKNFTSMSCMMRILMIFVVIFILAPEKVHAAPINGIISRQKRVSDQRLAELETLLALSRMHGKLVTVPVAFGRVDPIRIGRRRRSSLEYDLQKLRRILPEVTRDFTPVSEQDYEILSSSWQNENDRNDLIGSQLI